MHVDELNAASDVTADLAEYNDARMTMDQEEQRRQVDAVIDRANEKASRLLAGLDLSDAEREAATEYGARLIREATRALAGPVPLGQCVMPAAFAFALCWLEEAHQLTTPPPLPARSPKRVRRFRGKKRGGGC